MNKTVYPLVVGLLVVGLNAYAMQDGAAGAVKQVAAETPALVAPVAPAVSTVCHLCPVKIACQKAMTFCKRHPLCIAAGVAVATAVIIYNVVPVVNEKVHALLGIDSTKQAGSVEVETHAFPQEKIEVVTPA